MLYYHLSNPSRVFFRAHIRASLHFSKKNFFFYNYFIFLYVYCATRRRGHGEGEGKAAIKTASIYIPPGDPSDKSFFRAITEILSSHGELRTATPSEVQSPMGANRSHAVRIHN